MSSATRNALPDYNLDLSEQTGPAFDTEWLLVDGQGGFAMGSACGANTRRYHSLLTVARRPPVDRLNMLSSLAIDLEIDGKPIHLHTHEFTAPDSTVIHPRGWRYLQRFDRSLGCRWVYQVDSLQVTVALRRVWRRPATLIDLIVAPVPGTASGVANNIGLRLTPLVAMRDFHHLNADLSAEAFRTEQFDPLLPAVRITRDDLPRLHLACDAGSFNQSPDVWRGFCYRRDAERQQDSVEDLYAPGVFEHQFTRFRESVGPMRLQFAASTEPIDFADLGGDDGRGNHLSHLVANTCSDVDDSAVQSVSSLVVASDDFVVERRVDDQPFASILAGYPWFADWGRDAMICVPGLLLVTRRFDEARSTLLTFARHIRRGLVPNRFDDYGGEPHYNAVDASLWFVHAVLMYVEMTDDQATWRESLWPACRAIIEGYQQGTDGNIGVDDDGLVYAGDPTTQLTWMDAMRDGVAFTPRHGKAVEINALWYRALAGCAEAAGEFDDNAKALTQLATKVKRSFNDAFWSDELGYCYDHLAEGHADASFRPNQVTAAALPHTPLSETKRKAIVKLAREKLWTPMGMRTLPVDDPNYHGRYVGSMFERDRAYHQGTVWAWLIGPFVEAWLRAHRFSKKSRREASQFIDPLVNELSSHSLGQLHEVFDGDTPHAPAGCIAQAWSVAEVLRAKWLIETGAKS